VHERIGTQVLHRWNEPMGTPNCTRDLAYSTARSRHLASARRGRGDSGQRQGSPVGPGVFIDRTSIPGLKGPSRGGELEGVT